ncbi:MAG: DUF1501 domain-containing protein [Crocinitomicaceae bacterium]|nr:MAG: DUF1501 domain-containing protein [Crocinitomicaceae bacterium]
MKRRDFVKNMSLSSLTIPFVFNNFKYEAIANDLFFVPKMAEDRVLILIRLNGGNDGLNTVIPLDQYENLLIQRPNIIAPESSILTLNPAVGLHPVMTGMKNMFEDGKLSIIQNVGYPEQNRSHFRSMDIWTSGMMDISATRGWLGRSMDNAYPNFPDDYPNTDYPDPFAISMGYEVSATCQGLMANFSHTVTNPFDSVNLGTASGLNDGTYYGSHMEYLSTIIAQTNAYGAQVNDAANAGSTLSSLYDNNNPLAVQLRYIAQMISGGLKTKVYILNINGFDTHDSQVASTSTITGKHADLLKTLSDAIAAFQNDLMLLGLESRVAGMTFSEFGRQIASNASLGTDHGDAAPLFLFGGCSNTSIYGANPTITNEIESQAGIPMAIDFRDIYASVLKDWFLVDPTEIQTMFEHSITYHNVLGACNLSVAETEKDKNTSLVYPNPAGNNATLRVQTNDEWTKITLYDLQGRQIKTCFDGVLHPQMHHIPIDLSDLAVGNYRIQIWKKSGNESIQIQKVK